MRNHLREPEHPTRWTKGLEAPQGANGLESTSHFRLFEIRCSCKVFLFPFNFISIKGDLGEVDPPQPDSSPGGWLMLSGEVVLGKENYGWAPA